MARARREAGRQGGCGPRRGGSGLSGDAEEAVAAGTVRGWPRRGGKRGAEAAASRTATTGTVAPSRWLLQATATLRGVAVAVSGDGHEQHSSSTRTSAAAAVRVALRRLYTGRHSVAIIVRGPREDEDGLIESLFLVSGREPAIGYRVPSPACTSLSSLPRFPAGKDSKRFFRR